MQDDEAWISIGMQHLPLKVNRHEKSASTRVNYAYATLAATPPEVIISYLLPAGQHAPSTWEQEFAAALPNLYRASRPSNFAQRVPKSESLQYVSAPITSSSCDDDDSQYGQTMFVSLISSLCVVSASLAVAVCYIFHLLGRVNAEDKARLTSGL